jgi:hypothetical protein
MNAVYEVWNNRLGNLLGVWPTQEEALVVVRQIIGTAPQVAEDLSLDRIQNDGDGDVIADGRELADMAARFVLGRPPTGQTR